jgi:hypothetical protein
LYRRAIPTHCAANFRIAERSLSFSPQPAWRIASKYHAEAQRAKATDYDFTKSTNWRAFLDEVRTSFDANA